MSVLILFFFGLVIMVCLCILGILTGYIMHWFMPSTSIDVMILTGVVLVCATVYLMIRLSIAMNAYQDARESQATRKSGRIDPETEEFLRNLRARRKARSKKSSSGTQEH